MSCVISKPTGFRPALEWSAASGLIVTEREAGEGRIKVGPRITCHWLGPHDVQQVVSFLGHSESCPSIPVGDSNRERFFIGCQVGQFHSRVRKSLATIKHMQRQFPRRAKRIGTALRNNFQLETDRPNCKCLVYRGSPADLHQCLRSPALTLPARPVSQLGVLSDSEYRRKSFCFRIVVELCGRQFRERISRLHADDMKSLTSELNDEVHLFAFDQCRTEVLSSAVEEIGKNDYSVARSPTLACRTVADKKAHGNRGTDWCLKPVWLDPKVMSKNRRRNQQKRQSCKSLFHGRFSPLVPKAFERVPPVLMPVDSTHLGKSPSRFAASRGPRNVAIILFCLSLSSRAFAHDGANLTGGFQTGFLHPLSGLDHMLAMISVGLWGAALGRPLIIVLPVLFPIIMALGGGLGVAGVAMPPVEAGIALSVLVLGMMVALAVKAPVPVACAIVAFFALFHGYAHGREAPSTADPIGYSAGFVLSTGLLHLVGIAIGRLNITPMGAIGVRVAGAAIALIGIWFLTEALNP